MFTIHHKNQNEVSIANAFIRLIAVFTKHKSLNFQQYGLIDKIQNIVKNESGRVRNRAIVENLIN